MGPHQLNFLYHSILFCPHLVSLLSFYYSFINFFIRGISSFSYNLLLILHVCVRTIISYLQGESFFFCMYVYMCMSVFLHGFVYLWGRVMAKMIKDRPQSGGNTPGFTSSSQKISQLISHLHTKPLRIQRGHFQLKVWIQQFMKNLTSTM